jgi:hypothetical protein
MARGIEGLEAGGGEKGIGKLRTPKEHPRNMLATC